MHEVISKRGELIDLGVKADIVEKSGSWYSYNNERIGQGRENAKVFLKSNPSIADAIEQKLRKLSEDTDGGFIDKITASEFENED